MSRIGWGGFGPAMDTERLITIAWFRWVLLLGTWGVLRRTLEGCRSHVRVAMYALARVRDGAKIPCYNTSTMSSTRNLRIDSEFCQRTQKGFLFRDCRSLLV